MDTVVSGKMEAGSCASDVSQLGCCAGAILTKMDGDSRGGAALSVKAVSGKPIKFVGAGEKLEALEPFYPDRLTSRILGKRCCATAMLCLLATPNY